MRRGEACCYRIIWGELTSFPHGEDLGEEKEGNWDTAQMKGMRRPEERHGGEDVRKIPFETC